MAPKSARVKDRKTFRRGQGLWRGAVPCVSARMYRVLRAENFCARQAGGCAVPDPGRFGNQAFGHAPTLTWWPLNRHWRPDMAYDTTNIYETIELFGLTEKDAQLPIPEV